MKNRTKIIIGLLALCATSATLAACSVWDTPYDNLDKNGYNISVRYDINGGQFASTNNVNIVDVVSLEDALKGVKLIEPTSEKRGKDNVYSASRSGYSLVGWYSERQEKVDENGNALDDYGELCSVSGNAQGYTYSGKWDFDTDVLKVEDGNYSSENVVMTLYAAWVPNFTYTFYTQTSDGEWKVASTYEYNPAISSGKLDLPYWADEVEGVDKTTVSGEMVYGDFPMVENKTFSALYRDSAKTDKVTTSYVEHSGGINLETGTAISPNNNFYLDLLDGTWFHIYTAKQFISNSRIDGSYIIYDDLDFTDLGWSVGLAQGDFTGSIVGNGHTFSNISIEQTNYSQLRGGVFGRIMPTAKLENVTFDNVTYSLNAATRFVGGQFGLFAGSIDSSAKLENVKVKGELHIGNVYSNYSYYQVGLLCSNIDGLTLDGVTYDISLVVDAVVSGSSETYPTIAEVKSDGTVEFTRNDNPSVKP
jgi:hypothetical protein